MQILIIRHGDPDYSVDGLTPKGQKEAQLLSERLLRDEDIKAAYCSTMGRAKLTAKPTLEKMNLDCEYHDWLREFTYPKVKLPYLEDEAICWDLMPQFMDENPLLYSPTDWLNVDFIKNSDVPAAYKTVCDEFDKVLAKHGYLRDGLKYKVTNSNHDTIAFFCHFGLGGVLLSHLMNISPMSILNNGFFPPSSVTTVFSEERAEGIAAFRCFGMGDISHLYPTKEEASFSGRFCECFSDDTRH